MFSRSKMDPLRKHLVFLRSFLLTGLANLKFCVYLLRAVYGNVVFFCSKKDLPYKRLVFFRSLLLTAVINLMFCVYVLLILLICLHTLHIFV